VAELIPEEYVIYALAALAGIFVVEAVYMLLARGTTSRKRINRRLRLMEAAPDNQTTMVQLRRERGLSDNGGFMLPLVWFNRLIIQSGLTLGFARLGIFVLVGAVATFAGLYIFAEFTLANAVMTTLAAALIMPILVLRHFRNRRHKAFSLQFPEAIDIIVRSLKAGHPVPVAISMVARELPDPVGSEFGLVVDEVTYGSDLETALRNLLLRVGQADLGLFVTAVSIQTSAGGNLREILENLSMVVRMRLKMRRKIKALTAEGRISALILSGLPLLLFGVIHTIAPDFYGAVWHESATQIGLGGAGAWMVAGNLVMQKMVNFKI